ncbi:YjbF family lipoprotein [Pseudophaeobacter sp.]|uniref:YjbF family lipoprotein n=1 Tax=Pseudophaeobacter sp. TaxID=1971739 RepID=UPI003A981201
MTYQPHRAAGPRLRPLCRSLAGLVLLLGTAACNQGPEEASSSIVLGQAIREVISDYRAPDPAPVTVTRALLDQLGNPHLEVYIENRDLTGYAGLLRVRHDDLPGEITTWSTNDDIALFFRNGLLIGTRGLPGNLISADVPVQDNIVGPAQGGLRRYYLRGGNSEERRITMACELQDLGRETLEIYERHFTTQHLQERCEGRDPDGRKTEIINEYWVDSRSREIWKSRQWAGPETGYLRIRNLAS